MSPADISVNIDPRLLSVSSPTWDTFLILGYCAATIIYSFFAGRDRLVVVLVSLYASLAITLGTPEIQRLLAAVQPDQYAQYRLGVFIGGFVLLFVILSQKMSLRSDSNAWWQGIIISAFQVGLLISSILYFIPGHLAESGIARDYFVNDTARSIWMVGPVAAMLLIRKRSDEHHN